MTTWFLERVSPALAGELEVGAVPVEHDEAEIEDLERELKRLEARGSGLTDRIDPFVDRLADSGLWMSAEIRQRVLALAGEG
jgi:hypothetical protein